MDIIKVLTLMRIYSISDSILYEDKNIRFSKIFRLFKDLKFLIRNVQQIRKRSLRWNIFAEWQI